MKPYHKITTLWARKSEKPYNILPGQFAKPEFAALAQCKWVATEKVDGTNIRVLWDGQLVSFRGKSDNAQIPVHLYDRLAALLGGAERVQAWHDAFGSVPACLYGEGYGARIQKGGGNYRPDGCDFVLFDVRVGDWWLEQKNVLDVAAKFTLAVVPFVAAGTLPELSDLCAKGFDSAWGPFSAEGIVAKPEVELLGRNGERVITKLKHKDFCKLQQVTEKGSE